MQITDQQVRKLMMEYQKTGNKGYSALKAGMDRKTGRKYLRIGKPPSELKVDRYWRTRKDPFYAHWSEVKEILGNAPELEGKILFEWLCERYPDCYEEGQLRTFQRRIREWRALEGPDKEIFFPQIHEPGRIMETDFTSMNALKITICGEPFNHMLCHSVLTYSNWEWGIICHSECMVALKRGIQASLFRLGHIPEEHWTDHSTAATHAIGGGKNGAWEFNTRYLEMMNHYKMRHRTIQVDSPHENGDVESYNGVLKRRINQYLLLRGHRDFASVDEYRQFIESIMDKGNRIKQKRLNEELNAMRLLAVDRLPEYYEEYPRVTNWSTINVGKKTYSVPSRLRGEKVKAFRYEDRIEVFYHGVHQLTMPRITGDKTHSINYRHIIGWLIRKPGAFRRYRYREDLFPSVLFRWAYDTLCSACSERVAAMEYLRILQKAAHTMECRVAEALKNIQSQGIIPRWKTVMEFLPADKIELPSLAPLKVNLGDYDLLIPDTAEVRP
jgi:hypothetical protein